MRLPQRPEAVIQYVSRQEWEAWLLPHANTADGEQTHNRPNLAAPFALRNAGLVDSYHALREHIINEDSPDDDGTAAAVYGTILAAEWRTVRAGTNEYLAQADDASIANTVMQNADVQEYLRRRDALLEEASESLCELWPDFRRDMVAGVRQGIKLGYIPDDVDERLERMLNLVTIRVVDAAVIDVLVRGNGKTYAYYDADECTIYMAHTAINRYILAHEFIHAVEGAAFGQRGSEGEVEIYRGGFAQMKTPRAGLLKKYPGRDRLNEALTDHIARGVLSGDLETVDPTLRSDGEGTYDPLTQHVAHFISQSNGTISTRDFTNAYFEDSGQSGSTALRRALMSRCVASFGRGPLRSLYVRLEGVGSAPETPAPTTQPPN